MSIVTLLVHSILIIFFSILGGESSRSFVIKHLRLQMIMSFVSGFIISIAVSHLFPHSLELIPGKKGIEEIPFWILIGVVTMVILLRIFHFQPYDVDEAEGTCKKNVHHSPTSLWSLVMGLGLHALMEGVTLGASIHTGLGEGEGIFAGFEFLLVILLHKPIDAYSIIGMMRSCGYSPSICTFVNIVFALLCPLVMVLTFFGVELIFMENLDLIMGRVMAFGVGAFLCIALSDLLPEIQRHRHDSTRLGVVFLLGIIFSYSLHFISH